MTDRLTDLLNAEARDLRVPAPVPGAVLARGRSIRRRRRAAVAGAVAAVAVVVAASASLRPGTGDDDAISPADRTAYLEQGAWLTDGELHVGRHTVALSDAEQTSVHGYTSLGPLITTFDSTAAGLVMTTELVDPDGKRHPVDLPGLDATPGLALATDPATALVAYVRPATSADEAEVVVLDVGSDEVVATSRPFAATSPGATSTAFLGDAVVLRDEGLRFAWRSGELGRWEAGRTGSVTATGVVPGGYVDGSPSRGGWRVLSPTGDVRLAVRAPQPYDAESRAVLSPDGRFFAADASGLVRVHDVRSGESIVLSSAGRTVDDYAWTPDAHLIGVSGDAGQEVERCDPSTGRCESTGVPAPEWFSGVEGADGIPL